MDNEFYDRANKLYNAALLTRCCVQHFLSTYIDSAVNHKHHFIKYPFINKVMEFVDLHSIFKGRSVISFVPNYFINTEIFAINKPNLLDLLYSTLIKLLPKLLPI